VMGDFNNDGFSDLAIANNGNSLITLFDGGLTGLTLAQTISLGASTHPTDLVVSGTKDGGLQFFVGAEGEDHAIAVDLSSNSTIVSPAQVPTDSDLADSGGLIRLSPESSSPSIEANASFFAASASVSTVQRRFSRGRNLPIPHPILSRELCDFPEFCRTLRVSA
jgi:hypothetical protein